MDLSFRWNIIESTAIPVALMFPLIVFVCMSLADVEMHLLSYLTFASLLSGFAFLTLVYLSNKEMSRYGVLSFITLMSFILFSFVNIEDSDLKYAIYMSIEIWMFQMLCFLYKDRIHIIIISATVFLSFCVYANFIHMMLHPNLWIIEDDKTNLGYLLGYNYNGMGFRFIVAVTFAVLCLKYSWKWVFNTIPVIILSIVPLVLTGSKTSLTGIALFTTICCIPFIRVQKLITNSVFAFVILFQLFVVFSGKGLENNEFAVYLIEDVLEKDITFTYRTYLWDMSLEKIGESPIWGFGNLGYDWYASHIHTSVGTGPCNLILSILLNGGIVFFLLFICVFYISIRKLYLYNEKSANTILAGIASIMLMHLMEALTYVFCFYLLSLAYYYPYIIQETAYTEKKKEIINDSDNKINS